LYQDKRVGRPKEASIYWAEKYSCTVTGVSLVQEHLDLVHRYASETGLAARIDTLRCDVHEIHSEPNQKHRYDAVIAIDSHSVKAWDLSDQAA
jgi:cyclopropane fatty-acyl-phospholipid synthase-like methyltransferase